jgi:hypothetical protein
VAVAFQAYYDGSGSPACNFRGEVITLAGYAATPTVWAEFEAEWCAVLKDNRGRPACECLHMADANALQEGFSRNLGWTEQAVHSLLTELLNRCFSPRGMHRAIADALVGAACSVDLAAYERVCAEQPHFRQKRPEALCVDHVVAVAIQQLVGDRDRIGWGQLFDERRSIELFFDQNESYRHHIQRVWQARRWSRRTKPLKLISSIDTTCGRESARLQAADFLAWHANRDVCSKSGDLSARMKASFAARCSIVKYDYDELKGTAARWDPDRGYRPVDEVA